MATRKESPLLHYHILEQIGDGAFGSVHKAKRIASNEIVAIKIMKKKLNGEHIKESKTLKKISAHPNIVQLHETFLDSKKDFYFVMEHMNGGNLYQFIKHRKESSDNISSKEIKTILYQILSGLCHIHHVESIFHRDIKPENVLVGYDKNDTMVVKLADFGLATSIKSKQSYTDYVSTRWYRAPEVILKSSSYSYPIDLWAVGTIFAELVTLRPLFPGQSEIDQLFRICQVLGNPSSSNPSIHQKKSYHHILTQHQKLPPPLVLAGLGGEWREGVKLAQKMGFQFPKILPRVHCLSSVLQPYSISNDGLDLLSKLLKYDPSKRITSLEALNHAFFSQEVVTTTAAAATTTITTAATVVAIEEAPTSPTSKMLFDLPIIPLSPFKLEEYSQWDLLKQATPSVYSVESPFPRTTSHPNSLYNIASSCDALDFEGNTTDHNSVMRRSISDLSIPSGHQDSQPQQQQKSKSMHRLGLWAKKHIIV